MNFSTFINYKLISTKDFDLTVYDLFLSLLIIVITIIILRLIKSFFKRLERRGKVENGNAASVYKIIHYLIWTIIFTIQLELMGVDITVLIAGSAALFVGLGFGLQNLFNDFASGLILLFDRTLKVGDIVELDDGTVGEVLNINLRISEIRNRDNITIIVPNSKLVNDKVINWSHMETKTRFNVKVAVAYGSDLKKVQEQLIKASQVNQYVLKNPEPFVRFKNFGDSALEFELFFWTKKSFRVENIKSDIRIEIDHLFKENEIVIAFPQLDVHLQKK